MMYDLGIYAAIVGIIAIVLVLVYAAIRAIDHSFKCRETDREYAYETMIQNDGYTLERFGKRQELELGYKYNKQLIQSFCDRNKQMSKDLIKSINDSLLDMAKKMGEL